jgi:hypothetical protein
VRALLAAVVLLAAPVATTGAASNITQTTATVAATVDPNGAPTSYHFEYGTSTSYGLSTAAQLATGDDPVQVQAALSGLTSDTTYHYRVVVSNVDGGATGADRTLRTLANPRPPGVSTGGARSVGPSSATLSGSVDPNTAATTYRFEYGTSTAYGSVTAARSAGAGDRSVSVTAGVGSLRPNTRYHFRRVATNAAGTTRGRDRSFTSARQLSSVSIALDPSRVTWSRSLAVSGRVRGAGAAGAPLALQAQAFPFGGAFTQIATRNAASNGTYSFTVPSLFVTTRLRVVSRTQVVATSPVATASSAVRVGARLTRVSRTRARIEGTIWPLVPDGRVSLQRRSRSGSWVFVKRVAARQLDANRSRYRFSVQRARKPRTYRVVVIARDGGAHVPGASRELRLRARRSALHGG